MPLRTSYQLRRSSIFKRRYKRYVLGAVLLAMFLIFLRIFYLQNTILVPTKGGTYIEGSIGTLRSINPWFVPSNDVSRDISSLIFSGLLRYDPLQGKIVEDLATIEVSEDGRLYTLTLKDEIYWHDSTPEDVHPVTVEDVLFTYGVIQNEEFPNPLLRQNFSGVEIEQIDERTVRFKLSEPYRFFPSNLTLGLLPRRAFEGIPVALLNQTIDFDYNPVGAGPYEYKGFVQTELSSEVTLTRFERPSLPEYHLDSIVFRIFPDFQTLLSDLRNLQGVRIVPTNEKGEPLIPKSFKPINYSLPQYVALFFNLDRPILNDDLLRLGLQLGMDKDAISQTIHESNMIDSPLLEIAKEDWRFTYNPVAAQGALFQSNWNLPEKVRLQELLEITEANNEGVLRTTPIVSIKESAVLVLTGSIADVNSLTGSRVNSFPLQPLATDSGSWTVAVPAFGPDGLKDGINRLQLINDNERLVDTFYVRIYSQANQYNAAVVEQELLDQFLVDRNKPEAERTMTVADMYIDEGFLRARKSADPTEIRINDNGERLALTLLTSPSPPEYIEIAKIIKEQWRELGVHVGIEVPETFEEFERRMITREYDILLFGQSLLDNLDSYPYWHSSGVQEIGEETDKLALDAYNLSQYKSLQADALLELIRKTGDIEEREESLVELNQILNDDIPALVLYSPTYTYAYQESLQGIEIGTPSLHSDRFLTLNNWFVRERRVFLPGKSWLSLFSWLIGSI